MVDPRLLPSPLRWNMTPKLGEIRVSCKVQIKARRKLSPECVRPKPKATDRRLMPHYQRLRPSKRPDRRVVHRTNLIQTRAYLKLPQRMTKLIVRTSRQLQFLRDRPS